MLSCFIFNYGALHVHYILHITVYVLIHILYWWFVQLQSSPQTPPPDLLQNVVHVRYYTSTGERESHPFREEPWHLHYVSSLSMHSALPTRQPPFMDRSLQLVEVRPYAEEEDITN